ncbi:MFS transporter [Paractinoplanes globisporus]|uniref:MFS transporter n=1 Tax=Paractinoplanes globisporus TaxID=113565 RepID=A0ABW6WD69_9ACTN|nr:MFS transporter [Actinoplanes globisporus]
MLLTPYRETLALPGIKSLLAVATLARIPIAAGAVVLTLHVVTDLGRGYGAAGLVGAALTIGGSVGAPVIGRLIDRRGLRPALILTTVAEVIFWTVAQSLPYWPLLIFALFGGFLALPAFSVARQSIAALTPEAQRLPAFALDSITTEISFMAGPALGVLIATGPGPRVAMLTIAAGILASGLGLWLLNPPVRAEHEAPIAAGERVPRRSWLRPRFVAILAVTLAATLVLSGTDVTIVAVLRENGELSWSGVVMSLWAFYSLLGGFAYGTMHRRLPAVAILTPMAVLTMAVALGSAHWWLLAILLIPCGALCAPTITASADAVSRMTPASARGEAMGLHNSSLTVGVALGGPLAGLAADTLSPPWGFVTVGGIGTLIALAVLPAELLRRRRSADPTAASAPTPQPDHQPEPALPSPRPSADAESPLPTADALASGTAGPADIVPTAAGHP